MPPRRTMVGGWRRGLALGLSLAIGGVRAGAQSIDDSLVGPDSPYTARLARIASRWPAGGSDSEIVAPIELTCFGTADSEAYVGTSRRAMIRAPVEAVEAVLNDIAHYRDWLPGVVDVHVVPGSTDGNRFTTSWEQKVPVFFLPNVTYELSQAVDKSRPGVTIYRYKLRRSQMLLASDGVVVLEALTPTQTRFTEYGFFQPRGSVVPSSVIWRQSVRGAFLSAAAIKLKAEHPGWSYRQIGEEGERLEASAARELDQCVADRHRHRLTD